MDKFELGRTGEKIPALGLGTFGVGGKFRPDGTNDAKNIEVVEKAVGMGYTLIDTAEAYGGGHTEELVGKAIQGIPRDELFIVSKVSPENCKFLKVIRSGKGSARRLGKYVDLFLIHTPPKCPIKETVLGMEKLVDMGLVRYIGVSNFSPQQTIDAVYAAKKHPIVANQSEMNLIDQSAGVLDVCRDYGLSFMGYRPLGGGALLKDPRVSEIKKLAEKHSKTPAQVALRWVLDMNIITIVKSSSEKHLKENLGAVGWNLGDDWDGLRKAFQ